MHSGIFALTETNENISGSKQTIQNGKENACNLRFSQNNIGKHDFNMYCMHAAAHLLNLQMYLVHMKAEGVPKTRTVRSTACVLLQLHMCTVKFLIYTYMTFR